MSATRPRVLVLTVGFGIGGAERLILWTAPRLRDAGFDVTVAALKGRGPLADRLEAQGVPAVSLDGRRHDPRTLVRLLRYLRRGRFDLLHTHLFLANVAGRVAGRLAGVPVIVAAHHDTDVWMKARHRLLERLTAPLGDCVVACSEAVRRYAVETYGLTPKRVITLRNGIEIAPLATDEAARRRLRAGLGAGPDDLLVGGVGRLVSRKKGYDLFVEAAAAVAAQVPRARFVLAGEGPDRAALETRARDLGISGRLVFAGLRDDVHDLMGAFDLFVQPSRWEGFGLSILEAMAASRPVVAARVGGIPEIVADGVHGRLVPPDDAGALARAIAALLRDRDLALRLGRAGRARVEAEFGLDRLVGETAELYRTLLRGRAAGAAAARVAA